MLCLYTTTNDGLRALPYLPALPLLPTDRSVPRYGFKFARRALLTLVHDYYLRFLYAAS